MIPVLDHGYITLVESWGSDERIIESARMSTDKGFQGWGPLPCPHTDLDGGTHARCPKCLGAGTVPGDEKLLKFLWEHQHHTPFEMAGLTLEVQAPIFVFREWHRHRTQSYNELSARYTPLPDLQYLPSTDRLMTAKQSSTNKQGSEAGLPTADAEHARHILLESYNSARLAYERLLSMGVAKEVARLVVPVAQYSRMRASANLRNWLAFWTLRSAPNAQWEIRQYADRLGDLIATVFPRVWNVVQGP